MNKVGLGNMFSRSIMTKAILGIDISKKKFDVELRFDGKKLKRQFNNAAKGHGLLHGWLLSLHLDEVHACLEATGGYGDALAEFLYERGHRVSVVNPLRIKAYAQSDLKRNKTDSADAGTIAEFCVAKEPEAWHPLPVEIKHLQALTRRIESLEEMVASERNRLETAQPEVRPSLKRIIKALEKEVAAVERLIKEHIDNHPGLKQQNDLLESIPGIGQKTAQLLLGEIEFSVFESARGLAAQAGLSPHRDQSGTTRDRTRLSKLGNGRIRKALYFPAIVAIRHNEIIKSFADRLSQRGKTPMQIVCAAMRKLLHIAFGVIKNNRPFDPNTAFSI